MLYDFKDYRGYIKDYLASLPRNGRGELSRMAEFLGVNNTLLSQVLAGTRELSIEQAYALCGYWGLGDEQTDYFMNLVQIDRAGTKAYREHLEEKRDKMIQETKKLVNKIAHQKKLNSEDRKIFYSSWVYSAIHLYTTLNPKGATLDDIASRLRLTKNKVNAALEFLERAGLVASHDHRWKVAIESTFLEHGSIHLQQHHRNWRLKAIEKADDITAEELMYTGQVSLSHEDFTKIRALLAQALESTSKIVVKSPAEEIACIHVDWFWL